MAYRIAICDDSAQDRIYIADMVRGWANACGHGVTIREFAGAEQFLFENADTDGFDILLLDIEMGGMDGVTMARTVRRDNATVQIVFITGYSDYIAEGYDVEALHYLMKPVKEEKLREVLSRAAEKLAKNEKVLSLDADGGIVRVPVHTIRYAVVSGNYVTIHAAQDVTVKMTLTDLMEELDDRFYRAGRSAIVNLTRISRVTRTEIRLSSGETIPLARGAYDGVNRAMIAMR